MSTSSNLGQNRPGLLKGFWQEGQGVFLDYNGAILNIIILEKTTIRVRVAPSGRFLPRHSWAATRPDSDYSPVPYTFTPTAYGVEITTESLVLQVNKEGGLLRLLNKQGQVISEDAPEGGVSWDTSGKVSCSKVMPPDEHYYGFGERTGQLDKRGRRYTCWTTDPWYFNGDHGPGTDNMYQAIPFFMTLRPGTGSYGLFLNNSFKNALDMRNVHDGRYRLEIEGGELDYYLFYGPEIAQVISAYTNLTGRMPMPPRWALGYHQCRWSYYPEQVVRDLATQFRERAIPADVIHLDIDYMNGYRVFTWDKSRFPDPKKLLADLAAQGFKVVLIVDPGVKHQPDGGYPVYDEGKSKNYFLQNADGTEYVGYVWPDASVFPDFAKAEVRQWWGDLHQGFVADGVKGIWNDMNEPAIADKPFSSGLNMPTNPANSMIHGDEQDHLTWGEGHNVYALLEDRATYEGLRRANPNERPFILTRSGSAGIQKYAAVWTGDNLDLWEHLEMSIAQLCNLGLSGVGFSGADIGGFGGNGNPELFARWIQLGAFYPFSRGHSSIDTPNKEPWIWGQEVEEISRRALSLRYRLLPYLYSLFYTTSQTGAPIWRPLFYHFANDLATHTLGDEVMVGHSLLVAPIYRPGQTRRMVYLPEGIWYDFWTDSRIVGPTYLLAEAELDTIPLYMRGGAIVPFGPDLNYTDEKPLDNLVLEVYPDANGVASGILYEDDGLSFGYERGEFCLTRYACRSENGKAIISAQRQGQFAPHPRSVEIWLHGPGEARSLELPHDTGTWQVEI